ALRPVFDGGDIDPDAIRAARENAAAAGLSDAIRWEVRALVQRVAADASARPGSNDDDTSLPAAADPPTGTATGPAVPSPRGLVVCNPPYDARLAADPALYRALGDALRRAVPQWRASLLCGDRELAFATGLRAKKTYQVSNGALECVLVVCDPILPAARADAVPRVLSEGAGMVANRLRKTLKA